MCHSTGPPFNCGGGPADEGSAQLVSAFYNAQKQAYLQPGSAGWFIWSYKVWGVPRSSKALNPHQNPAKAPPEASKQGHLIADCMLDCSPSALKTGCAGHDAIDLECPMQKWCSLRWPELKSQSFTVCAAQMADGGIWSFEQCYSSGYLAYANLNL